jgi:ribosomal protein S18 acetylase RimI-like enzyme
MLPARNPGFVESGDYKLTPAQEKSVSVTLRPVEPDDQPFQMALYATTRDDLNLLNWDAKQKQTLIDMQFRAQSAQYSASYPQADNSIILIDGGPVGRIIVDRNEQAISLVDIGILPAHRNAGVGTRLIRGLIEEASASGRPVKLHVLKSNPAQRLYLRLGFSIVGDDGLYFEMKSETK